MFVGAHGGGSAMKPHRSTQGPGWHAGWCIETQVTLGRGTPKNGRLIYFGAGGA